MASASDRSLPFARVRSPLSAGVLVQGSERNRTRANAEPCHRLVSHRPEAREARSRRLGSCAAAKPDLRQPYGLGPPPTTRERRGGRTPADRRTPWIRFDPTAMTEHRRERDAFIAAASDFCRLYEDAKELGTERFLLGLAGALPRLQAAAVELPYPDDEIPADDLDVDLTTEEVDVLAESVAEVLREIDWDRIRDDLPESSPERTADEAIELIEQVRESLPESMVEKTDWDQIRANLRVPARDALAASPRSVADRPLPLRRSARHLPRPEGRLPTHRGRAPGGRSRVPLAPQLLGTLGLPQRRRPSGDPLLRCPIRRRIEPRARRWPGASQRTSAPLRRASFRFQLRLYG